MAAEERGRRGVKARGGRLKDKKTRDHQIGPFKNLINFREMWKSPRRHSCWCFQRQEWWSSWESGYRCCGVHGQILLLEAWVMVLRAPIVRVQVLWSPGTDVVFRDMSDGTPRVRVQELWSPGTDVDVFRRNWWVPLQMLLNHNTDVGESRHWCWRVQLQELWVQLQMLIIPNPKWRWVQTQMCLYPITGISQVDYAETTLLQVTCLAETKIFFFFFASARHV